LLGAGLYGTTRSVPNSAALALPVAVAVAVLVSRPWLRNLLGAALACLCAVIVAGAGEHALSQQTLEWLPWHATALAWLALLWLQQGTELNGETAHMLALLESVASGMAAMTLAALAFFSGKTFLVSGLGDNALWFHDAGMQARTAFAGTTSAVLAAAACAWLAVRWPAVRTAWFAAIACLVGVVAWFVPFLGVTWLILAVCAATRRYALACCAGAAALWMIGGLYYQLEWPLGAKAGVLAGVGLATAAVARFVMPGETGIPLPQVETQPGSISIPERRSRLGLLLSAVLVLAVANAGIWQKEAVIQSGTQVFVELAPVDPRSLMQGDYMALRFALPQDALAGSGDEGSNPTVIARSDERGITKVLRHDDGTPLGDRELRIKLVTKHGRWTIASDAWFFREGESARWAKARYGEFRVDSKGNALLVGLRGPDLEKL
jgi:uncharacterized membrane-anchored protein